MPGALSHIRVLNLSRALAGPWVGQVLADLGAEVIKIERPDGGNDTRTWGPPFLEDVGGNDTSEAAYYLSASRNKKSVTVDLTQPEGQRIVYELAVKADILPENFKVGGLKAYGLDYESLKQVNPKLIYCSIAGFGQSDPCAKRAGCDFMIQGLGSLMSLTGHADNEEGAGPVKVSIALTNILTGLCSSTAVLTALAHRDVSGIDQHIDMALLDAQVACLANQTLNYLTAGVPPWRLGNAHPNIVPYQDFSTADDDMILTVGNDSQFRKFAKLADHPEWAGDPRFVTSKARVANREVLIPLIRQTTVLHTTIEWILSLERVGVPCGPINDLAQVLVDPQVQAHGLRVELPHPLAGMVSQVASPIRLSKTPVEYRNPPSTLGQHTNEVLETLLGLDAAALERLRDGKVIRTLRTALATPRRAAPHRIPRSTVTQGG